MKRIRRERLRRVEECFRKSKKLLKNAEILDSTIVVDVEDVDVVADHLLVPSP